MSDLVGNPEDRFSRVEAHLILLLTGKILGLSMDINRNYNYSFLASSIAFVGRISFYNNHE